MTKYSPDIFEQLGERGIEFNFHYSVPTATYSLILQHPRYGTSSNSSPNLETIVSDVLNFIAWFDAFQNESICNS